VVVVNPDVHGTDPLGGGGGRRRGGRRDLLPGVNAMEVKGEIHRLGVPGAPREH